MLSNSTAVKKPKLERVPPGKRICKIPRNGNYYIKAEVKLQDMSRGNKNVAILTGIDQDWDIILKTVHKCSTLERNSKKCQRPKVEIIHYEDFELGCIKVDWLFENN
tara:strand:+ start:8267 stop:8587 length:321 start_codon:yes stop_codon:yes gene_type:complete